MSFKIERFGSDSSNAKSMLGGINYYRYYNKENDTVTNAGYFPADLGLEVGDRICVTPKVVTDADKWYVVSNITNRTITVSELGNDVDLSKVVNADTLPTASADENGKVYLYTGETDESYTHGYVYECQATPVYDSTVEFNPASLSGTTAACSGSDFAALVAKWGTGDIDTIIKGTLTYDESGELLVFVGQDDTDTTVCTFQLYAQDYIDAGFTFTGTFQDGDVIAFTCTIEQTGYSYAWARIDTQPQPAKELPTQAGHSGEFLTTNGTDASWSAVGGLPSQTGNSGKFLTTDGTDASWSDKPLQNDSTNSGSLAILGRTNSSQNTNCVVIGESATAGAGSSSTSGAVVIGYSATTNNNAPNSITIGYKARSEASGAITIGNNTTNNVANFVMIGETSTAYGLRVGKYHMLNSATGIITADRLGTGYDATKIQTLKNIQGVLTWVDD